MADNVYSYFDDGGNTGVLLVVPEPLEDASIVIPNMSVEAGSNMCLVIENGAVSERDYQEAVQQNNGALVHQYLDLDQGFDVNYDHGNVF